MQAIFPISDISALLSTQQQSQEMVHHFWARFLLVKNKIKDCRDEDAILAFRNNCMDEGILNAINRHHILHLADLATIVQKYSAMESTWRDRQFVGSHWSQLNHWSRRKGRIPVTRTVQ